VLTKKFPALTTYEKYLSLIVRAGAFVCLGL